MAKSFADLLHLFYPHNCEGCGTDMLNTNRFLCARCLYALPATGFFAQPGNAVERIFFGRCAVEQAGACYYFTKHSVLQHIVVQLKYFGNQRAGHFLGRMTGHAIADSGRFTDIDVIVPLPLNAKKEFRRGYNQAAVIAWGITEVWPRPVITDAVVRNRFTETQTRQNRISRWQNMEHVFSVADPDALAYKHILLVDDVVTTGATLEACTACINQVPGVRVSIAAVAYTS